MCRQSRNNRYRKCYLKKPQLYTIPEETGEGVITVRMNSQTGQSYSPKGIKRLMNNSYNGTKSPRCQKPNNKKNEFNSYGSYSDKNSMTGKGKANGFSKSLFVITPNMGDASPKCRRVRKTEQNSAAFRQKNEDMLIDLGDEVGSASPRTVKRLIVSNANMGNQSPQCRRAVKNKDSNTKESLSNIPSGTESPKIIKKVMLMDSEVGSRSPPCRRVERKGDSQTAGYTWNGTNNKANDNNSKDKKNLKDKSLLKRMVKFLTVPPQNDFAVS